MKEGVFFREEMDATSSFPRTLARFGKHTAMGMISRVHEHTCKLLLFYDRLTEAEIYPLLAGQHLVSSRTGEYVHTLAHRSG